MESGRETTARKDVGYCAALPGPGSGGGGSGGGGGVTLQLGCSELCTIRGNTFSDNTADQANGGGVLAQA